MGQFNEYHQYREEVDAAIEIINFEQELLQLAEVKKTHPSKGMSEKKKSDIVKKARRGEDMFGKGKNFEKIAKKAGKKYGDEEAGRRVAGAIFWKKAKGKHMTKEEVDDMIWIIEDDLEVILDHAIHYVEHNSQLLFDKYGEMAYHYLTKKMGFGGAGRYLETMFSDPEFVDKLAGTAMDRPHLPQLRPRELYPIIDAYMQSHA